MLEFLGSNPILSFKNTNRNYKPMIQDYESVKDAPLRDAIIYLERKSEELEEFGMMVNVYGLTKTEIEEMNVRHKAFVAPYRRAIYELKKISDEQQKA